MELPETLPIMQIAWNCMEMDACVAESCILYSTCRYIVPECTTIWTALMKGRPDQRDRRHFLLPSLLRACSPCSLGSLLLDKKNTHKQTYKNAKRENPAKEASSQNHKNLPVGRSVISGWLAAGQPSQWIKKLCPAATHTGEAGQKEKFCFSFERWER